MIDNLLSPDLINSALTKMVLVNALYFKGLWKSRFRPENTKKRTFVAADGKSYQVPMLAQLSLFQSGEFIPGEVRLQSMPAAERPMCLFLAQEQIRLFMFLKIIREGEGRVLSKAHGKSIYKEYISVGNTHKLLGWNIKMKGQFTNKHQWALNR